MKFLCVSCDEQMKLADTFPPESGSITVVYRCAVCQHEIAMITNPFETEVVGSLGVKIGGKSISGKDSSNNNTSACPFANIANEMKTPKEDASVVEVPDAITWTQEALNRLENIPEFVRPMAKEGIERMAQDKEYPEINHAVLDEAKDFFGM